jgi:hypothetical protein
MEKSRALKTIDGIVFPAKWPDFLCLLWLFRFGNALADDPDRRVIKLARDLPGAPERNIYTGAGRFDHAVTLSKVLFRKKFEWHDWSERAIRLFSENPWACITGCGGSSKSTSAAIYAIFFYLCDPLETAVLIVSTTIDASRRRIWREISKYWQELVRLDHGTHTVVGDATMLTSPKPCIRGNFIDPATNRLSADSAHGIYVIPVAKGQIEDAINEIKGFHPKRLLVVADELDSISQAIVDVCANLQIGTQEFEFKGLGNDPGLFNPLGRLMAPAGGGAITANMQNWKSASGVACEKFDGFNSPSIVGPRLFSGLITRKNIDAIVSKWGPDHPQVWIQVRGLHPPDGALNTVLTESMILRHRSRDPVTWQTTFIASATCDPAFGGDRCMYRTFQRGIDNLGRFRMLCVECIPLNIVAGDPTNPIEYQIAAQCKSLCQSRSIPPQEFAIDCTGSGRGAASTLQREWSPQIVTVEFGGAPSDMPVSNENPVPAKDEYDRKVTELWYSIREFIQAEALRGLDDDTAIELCSRFFEVRGSGASQRISIETKEKMKERGLDSPDKGDSLAVYVELCRRKGIAATIPGAATPKTGEKSPLEEFAAACDFDSGACYEEE